MKIARSRTLYREKKLAEESFASDMKEQED